VTDEFDLSTFQNRPLDHGCFSPLSLFAEAGSGWPFAVVPLAVGVLQAPMPTARRCLKLGRALRRAIESYPDDLKVVLVGTGGLSHQVHGERAGFNNPEWDRRFLDLIAREPETLADMTHAAFAEAGGWESAEVIMWLVMRGALSDSAQVLSQTYCLPSMTGIATLLLEEPEAAPDTAALAAHRARMAEQLAGTERLTGTYPFTLEVANRAYRINAYLHAMTRPAHRERFLEDPQGSFDEAGLSPEEQRMISTRDWIGLIRHGAIFFGLEKLAAVLGIPNAVIYAAMRGETLEAFQQSRNAPGALYSVGDVQRKDRTW
jgi:gallate dioxygenase